MRPGPHNGQSVDTHTRTQAAHGITAAVRGWCHGLRAARTWSRRGWALLGLLRRATCRTLPAPPLSPPSSRGYAVTRSWCGCPPSLRLASLLSSSKCRCAWPLMLSRVPAVVSRPPLRVLPPSTRLASEPPSTTWLCRPSIVCSSAMRAEMALASRAAASRESACADAGRWRRRGLAPPPTRDLYADLPGGSLARGAPPVRIVPPRTRRGIASTGACRLSRI